jgi:diguanylate cyclase (GGDEF)-like protein
LRSCLRPDDLAARWGGEEFVLVLPGSGRNGAALVLERIRERLADLLAVGGVVVPFTLSFGVCDATQATDFDETVRLADEALLRAKRSGRDRIVCHGQEILDESAIPNAAPGELPVAS